MSRDSNSHEVEDLLNSVVHHSTCETCLGYPKRENAKTLVGNLEGAVEKAANVYRSNPTLKSRMILAIENLVSEAEQL